MNLRIPSACGPVLAFLGFAACLCPNDAAAEKFALLVSIGTYAHTNYPALLAPPNDLTLWQDTLAAYGFRADNITVLQDTRATKAAVVAALERLAFIARSGDNVLIAFSGHGTRILDVFEFPDLGVKANDESDKNDEGMVLFDSHPTDPRSFLIDDEFAFRLGHFAKGVEKNVLLDTCYAGGMERGADLDWLNELWVRSDNATPPDTEPPIIIAAVVDKTDKVQELLSIPTDPPINCSISPLTYSWWSHTTYSPNISCGDLVRRIARDYKRWSLPWRPGLLAPSNTLNHPYLAGHADFGTNAMLHLIRWETNAAGSLVQVPFAVSRRALANNGNQRKLELAGFRGPAAGGAVGKRMALVVGINKWLPGSGLPELQGAVNDARGVAACLSGVEYEVVLMTPDASDDLKPTRGNIMEKLSEMLKNAQPTAFLLYWAGHGMSYENQAYLMPMDGRVDHPNISGLSIEELKSLVTTTGPPSAVRAMVFDVCRAGADKPPQGFVDGLRVDSQWLLVTSCSSGEYSYEILPQSLIDGQVPEASEPHGLVSYYLLTSRYGNSGQAGGYPADRDADGVISLEEAVRFAQGSLRQWNRIGRRSNQSNQSPRAFGSLSDESSGLPFAKVQAIGSATRSPSPDKIPPSKILQPTRNSLGQFVVYDDLTDVTRLPFIPYGWMWGNNRQPSERDLDLVTHIMEFSLDSTNSPYGGKGTCISWRVTWEGGIASDQKWNALWAAIGLFSGPDAPAWWAQPGDNRGVYYDLEHERRFQRLNFRAYSPREGTKLEAKVGMLARDAKQQPLILGDSLAWPIAQTYALTANWQQYSLPLRPLGVTPGNPVCVGCRGATELCRKCGNNPVNPKSNNLERICSLGFAVKREPGDTGSVLIFIDDVYFD